MIGSSTFERPSVGRPPAVPFEATPTPTDHPGRWLGGLAGAVACVAAAAASHAIDPDASRAMFLDFTGIALLGIPIGFALGRALWPQLRTGGWLQALGIGLALGWAAPPLGALEIVLGQLLLPPAIAGATPPITWLIVLPIAIPVSYLAIVVTLPVGIAWSVLARLIPRDVAVRLRAPRPLERLGVRHALIVLVVWAVVVQLAGAR